MRRLALTLGLILVVASCGDDDSAPTAPTTATSAASTSAPATSAVTAAPSTTTAQAIDPGPTDCLEIWPEPTVQAIAGPDFTFTGANPDSSACTFFAAGGIALGWRTGDLAGLETSRSGAGGTAGTEDVAVCDAGFLTELEGGVLIMEAYSAQRGRVYTATVSGFDLGEARPWAEALLAEACG